MAKKKYNVDILSPSSINVLKNELNAYKNSLQSKCDLLAKKLAEQGVDIAQAYVYGLDAVFTGDLFKSIHSEKRGSGIYAVVTDNESAFFVEFGTGTIGKETSYPYPLPEGVSWEYATGKTIHQLADGRFGWFYPADDGNWYFTEGMPSRPFLTMTANELRTILLKTVKEVFKND